MEDGLNRITSAGSKLPTGEHLREPVTDRPYGADGGFFFVQTKRPQGGEQLGPF
jgi:hypothetical protein